VNEFLSWLLDAVQSVDPVLRTVLAGVAIMLETSVLVGLIVPGDTVVIVAATAVGSVAEAVVLIVVVIVGALIGESVGFWLGRWLGPRIRFRVSDVGSAKTTGLAPSSTCDGAADRPSFSPAFCRFCIRSCP
jgi:membrane protein DedA with SNARE-associated domain